MNPCDLSDQNSSAPRYLPGMATNIILLCFLLSILANQRKREMEKILWQWQYLYISFNFSKSSSLKKHQEFLVVRHDHVFSNLSIDTLCRAETIANAEFKLFNLSSSLAMRMNCARTFALDSASSGLSTSSTNRKQVFSFTFTNYLSSFFSQKKKTDVTC